MKRKKNTKTTIKATRNFIIGLQPLLDYTVMSNNPLSIREATALAKKAEFGSFSRDPKEKSQISAYIATS